MMFHGVRYYAVYGRNGAKTPSLKVYDGQCANSPLREIPCIPNNELVARLKTFRGDRHAMQAELERIAHWPAQTRCDAA
jgi:hypothetical protein